MGKTPRKKKTDVARSVLKDGSHHAASSRSPGKNLFHKPAIHCLLIVLIGLLAYSNSFKSPFQWDENLALVENPIIKNLTCFVRPSLAKEIAPDYYLLFTMRYIGDLTFALNYRIHGFEFLGYHILNIAIHLLNALLVYFLASLTFRTPFLRESSIKDDSSLIALFSGLLFVSHPIQTEAVTYIFQRYASLVTLFYLSALIFYIRWRLRIEGKDISRFKSILYPILSLMSAVFAMKTKENAFTLPILMMVYEFFFFKGPIKSRFVRLIPWLLTLVIVPLNLLQFDNVLGAMIGQIADPSSLLVKDVSPQTYLLTQFRVILTYIRLLFLPIHQNFDYDYPIYHSFFSVSVFLPFLFHLTLLGLGVYLFRRSKRTLHGLRICSFGIFWFFVTLSVESSIIPLAMMICEYRIYLPSVGCFVAITTALFIATYKLKSRFPGLRKQTILFLALIVILLSVLAYSRNRVWMDQGTMWEDVVRKSPQKARGYTKLGIIYAKRNQPEDAIRAFQMALKVNPSYAYAYLNLGIALNQQNRPKEAEKALQVVLKLNPGDYNAYYNLGVIYGQQNRLKEAERAFQEALRLKPQDVSTHNNLGVVFAQLNQWDEAIKEFQAALRLDPNHTKTHTNLGLVYEKKGELDDAVREFQTALRLNPTDSSAQFHLQRVQKRLMP